MSNLFVIIATGQRVSNLPPVLEHASPGDYMLWVETDEARNQGWAGGPRAVLESHGLVEAAGPITVPRVNDPVELAEAVRPFAQEAEGKYGRVFLVANGGTKLSPVGLLFGFESLSPQLLYGDEKPAAYSLYPTGLDSAPAVGSYVRHGLDLGDILRLNGHTFATQSRHRRIWPDSLPADLASEPYGSDEPYTMNLHASAYARFVAPPAGEPVAFAHLNTVAPPAYERWRSAVQNFRRARVLNDDRLRDLYHATLNLDASARRAAGAAHLPDQVTPIGPAFERAVGRRVRAWVEQAAHAAIQSVWVDVKVAREAAPHQEDSQFDVLLVLKNGVLIHLECKSADVDIQDLDRRTHRLREAGSQLARLVVVLPLYGHRADEPWFPALHAARAVVEGRRLALLPFTWPGRPTGYPAPGSTPAEQCDCQPFEEALEALLRPYDSRPPAGPGQP